MPQLGPIMWLPIFLVTLLVTHMFLNLIPSSNNNPLKSKYSHSNQTTIPLYWMW